MQVSQNGQITIPQNIRNRLGIKNDTEVEFIEESGRFYLMKISAFPRKKSKFRRLRGIATVKMNSDEIMALTRGEE